MNDLAIGVTVGVGILMCGFPILGALVVVGLDAYRSAVHASRVRKAQHEAELSQIAIQTQVAWKAVDGGAVYRWTKDDKDGIL